MSLDDALQDALKRLLGLLGAKRGAVLLLDTQKDLLSPRVAQDWQDVSLNRRDLPLEWQRGFGRPHIVKAGGAENGAFRAFLRDDNETVIAAPLLTNGRFQGILAVATVDENGFDPRQLKVIDAAVHQIAANLDGFEVVQALGDQAHEQGLMLRQQQEESRKWQTILASIADGVVFNDRHGRIILMNRAAELILAVQAADLVGRDLRNLFDLFTAGRREDVLSAMRTLLADPMVDIPPDIAHTVLQLGKSTISARLAPVITTQGEFLGIVTIFRDITREVEADRAKNEFVSTVSHELRTPMTAIKGYTDLIISGMVGEINEDQLRFLTVIKNNTDRLTALVDDLLDIARIETGRLRFEPESVQLGDIVRNVVDALASRAESKSHTLTLRSAAGLPEIMADPHRLNQVFTNLVNNAINYTPDGGVINVEVYFVGGAIRVDVEDTGIGIATEDLHKIFERFYRVDHPLVHESPGTGLGLPIVKMFVEMHGGRVWVDSEVGNGSRFTVLLPVPTARPEEGLGLLTPQMVVRAFGRQVLVAADDPDIAELVKLHLEEAGYGVIVVGRGVRVLELARRWCPDLILLDIVLPDMDGRAVLEALKSEPQTAEIPVVMLTRVADDRTAFELGAAGYLTKPIDSQELLDVAHTALARRGRILLVEDDLDTIEMMRLTLRRLGYAVDIAANGYEALSLARRWRPEAIVLDLRLPGMDGYEALAHLKRSLNTQDIPIIVISAHAADPETEGKRLRTLGANSFLAKPFSVDQLIYEIDLVTGPVRSAQGRRDADSRK